MSLQPVMWHDKLLTWQQRNSFLCKKNFMSDCSFVVTENGHTTRIPAHKYILGGFSLDFYNLFYLMEAGSSEIPITDVSLQIFNIFLKFVYSEKTDVTKGNVWDVLKLAQRYSANNLTKHCEDVLIKMVVKSNCIEIMDRCSRYKMSSLTSKCLQMMDSNYLFTPHFLEIKLETLLSILKVEESCISEIDLFRAANKWAIRKCEKMNITPSGDNKRMVLGEAVMNIRFASMTFEELTECTDTESILTSGEGLQVFRFIGNGGTSLCKFSSKKRFKPFTRVINLLANCGIDKIGLRDYHFSEDPFKLCFNINKKQKIRGFGIQLNSSGPMQEKVTIKLLDWHSNVLLENICTVTVGNDPKAFDLLFKDGYSLQAESTYGLTFELGGALWTNNLKIPNIRRSCTVDGLVVSSSFFIMNQIYHYKDPRGYGRAGSVFPGNSSFDRRESRPSSMIGPIAHCSIIRILLE